MNGRFIRLFRSLVSVAYIISPERSIQLLFFSDEGGSGIGLFLMEFGEGATLLPNDTPDAVPPVMFKISDASGELTFSKVEPVSHASLVSSDAFLVDTSSVVYVWIGNGASLNERRLAPQYAQKYLHNKKGEHEKTNVKIPIIKVSEGHEPKDLLQALGA